MKSLPQQCSYLWPSHLPQAHWIQGANCKGTHHKLSPISPPHLYGSIPQGIMLIKAGPNSMRAMPQHDWAACWEGE